jgi:SAM-dependent methyltransferase
MSKPLDETAVRKTDRSYWDSGYERRLAVRPVSPDRCQAPTEWKILGLFRELGLSDKKIMEVGGGGSEWLARLALDYPSARFTCLDYSPEGCDLTRRFADDAQLANVDVVERDLFVGPATDVRQDIVYSLGVVEHFDRLDEVLKAIAKFAAADGIILTVIPNLSGVLGKLARWFSPEIYAIHVPHDIDSFVEGHRRAGLEVMRSGYLGSSNFGVLSSCFDKTSGFKYRTYVWLCRLTRVLDNLESRIGRLPETPFLAPYIYAISRPN